MKKNQILAGMFLAGITLGACTDDYTDWADPQSNSPEDAAAKYEINYAAGTDAAIVMDDVYAKYADDAESLKEDSVVIASLSSSNANIASIVFKSVNVNGVSIDAAFKDGKIKVNTLELDLAVRKAFNSRAHVERTLDVNVNATAKLTTGEAVSTSGTAQVKLTPVTTPAISEDGYYMLGNFQDWDRKNPVIMEKIGDGLYKAVVTTTAEKSWFKFYRAYDTTNPSDEIVNPREMGVAEDGDVATENFLVWPGDPSCPSPQAPAISGINDFIVTLDVVNMTFKVAIKTVDLFMTGSNYGWGNTWIQFVPIYGADGEYWNIVYLEVGEKIKFAPQAGWENDFGGQATVNDEAGVGFVADSDNNLEAKNAGWYLLHVINGTDRVVNVLAPNVYLNGNTIGGWDVTDAGKFTIPETKDGEFVSPAFVASDEVRMCVNFGGYDWWKTEFIVLDGKIVYRGGGNDQERVKVAAGQKAYLNFTAGTGSFK